MFYIDLDEKNKATLEYETKENNTVDFTSTYTPEQYRGQGIASKLIKTGLDWAVKSGYKIIPTCPAVQTYVVRHEEYQQHLAEEGE